MPVSFYFVFGQLNDDIFIVSATKTREEKSLLASFNRQCAVHHETLLEKMKRETLLL